MVKCMWIVNTSEENDGVVSERGLYILRSGGFVSTAWESRKEFGGRRPVNVNEVARKYL